MRNLQVFEQQSQQNEIFYMHINLKRRRREICLFHTLSASEVKSDNYWDLPSVKWANMADSRDTIRSIPTLYTMTMPYLLDSEPWYITPGPWYIESDIPRQSHYANTGALLADRWLATGTTLQRTRVYCSSHSSPAHRLVQHAIANHWDTTDAARAVANRSVETEDPVPRSLFSTIKINISNFERLSPWKRKIGIWKGAFCGNGCGYLQPKASRVMV